MMKISVPLNNDYLADEFGKYATDEDMVAGKPAKSFPIEIKDAPAATKSYAIYFRDYDSVPVCGFVWIHWLAANIPADQVMIPADASRQKTIPMIQGRNSNGSKFLPKSDAIINGYTGPQPPDKDHYYALTIYALDRELDLSEGFYLNEFRRALDGHILAKASVELLSRV